MNDAVGITERAAKFTFPLLFLAPILWGGNFVVGRMVGPDIPAHWLNVGRWVIAALCLMPLALPGLCRERRRLWDARRNLTLLAMLGVVGFNTILYAGLQTVTASQAAVVFAVTPL